MPSFSGKLGGAKDRIMRAYAHLHIRPTKQESRAYNNTNRILLTFDDDADKITISRLLSLLKKEKVRAAFFLIGKWTEQNPQSVESIRAAGHWIGNHSYGHRNLMKLSPAEIEHAITRGVSTELLRPPYGVYNDQVRKIAARNGYRIAYWTIDSDDWKGITASQIQENVLSQIHHGACVLLHLNAPHTLEALPGLIQGIRDRGFELCQDGTEISLK